jgi:MFS family permease
LIALLGIKDHHGDKRLAPVGESPLKSLAGTISIMWREPKTSLGGVVRIINTTSMFGFLVVLPSYFISQIGFTLEEWLRLLTIVFVSNIIGNWVASRVGNRIGLRNAVIFMGAIGSTIATPLFFYAPQWFHGDFLMISIAGVIYGAALGGFVPLSALMPILVPKNRAGALSVLSLGAGASTWVGPAIVAIFRSSIGISGIVWIFTGMYALSVLLMIPLREPRQLRSADQEERSSRAQQNDGRVAAH